MFVVSPKIKFRPSTSPDVASYRVREVADYDAPFVQVPKPAADADGFSRIPVSAVSFLDGTEGTVTVFLTAVDGAGNESDFLTVTGPLDLSPPVAPSAGSIE
jgi:hypothetical protein